MNTPPSNPIPMPGAPQKKGPKSRVFLPGSPVQGVSPVAKCLFGTLGAREPLIDGVIQHHSEK